MQKHRKTIIVVASLLMVAVLALLGGLLGKRSDRLSTGKEGTTKLPCTYDGTKITPLYQVEAYLADNTTARFCSVYCASKWLKENKDRVLYMTVTDEATGQKFDSTLGQFVESDVVTVPEVKNRVHVFLSKDDALKHIQQFHGKFVENPLGKKFELPKFAQFGKLTVGVPDLPDALPLRLALFRPIFKENRLDVKVVPFHGDQEATKLFRSNRVDALFCDLPTGLVLSRSTPSAAIVKNVLRPNPFRPLFGIVGQPGSKIQTLSELEGKSIAVPSGVSFRFYLEFYLRQADVPLDRIRIRQTRDVAEAWHRLISRDVSAALLRSPYTDMAMKQDMVFLADDRSLPWMSVLVVRLSVIDKEPDLVKRFIFALEQSVLALNLKPNEFRAVLKDHGGIPVEAREFMPMPIFEGANAPSKSELEHVVAWLAEKGLLPGNSKYEDLVNTKFLPDPDGVGLAFCCR